MKIIELQAENVMILKAVRIRPGDGPVILEGENGAGKTATLNCLLMPLTGEKVVDPVREGKRKGMITIDMGDYVVKQNVTNGGSDLKVYGPGGKGKPLGSPRALLDTIVGKLGFDPGEFALMKPTAQRSILMELAGLDFTEHDSVRTEVYDNRTQTNRDLKATLAQLDDMEAPGNSVPAKEISIAGALNSLDALKRQESDHAVWATKVSGREDLLRDSEAELADLERRVKASKELNKNTKAEIDLLTKEEPPTVDPAELEDAQNIIENAEEMNKAFRDAQAYNAKDSEARDLENRSEQMTREIEQLDKLKVTQISEADYPIDGLTVDDDQVLFHGRPLRTMSSGERIRVSVAIGMAMNPKLRVIIVKDGSLLDKAGMQAIIEMASKHDYQIWVERVSTGEKSEGPCIIFEAGEIKEVRE